MNKKFKYRFKESDIGKFNTANSDKVVEGIEKGSQVIGMTMGKFSLIDLIHSALKKTGPSDVYIATWSAGIKDAHQVKWMVDTNLIKSIRLLTDHSYKTRQAKYAMSITDLFGAENIRTSEMHAKFVLIENEDYKITIISSMNLNANKTCETFQIYTEEPVFQFYKDFVEHHFADLQEGFESSGAAASKSLTKWFGDNSDQEAATSKTHWSHE